MPKLRPTNWARTCTQIGKAESRNDGRLQHGLRLFDGSGVDFNFDLYIDFVQQVIMSAKKITARQVGAFLEDRARQSSFDDAPIFYSDLAAHFGLPPVTEAWFTHPLCRIFEELDVEDAKRGCPFRTVLVVGQKHSIPGPGFFKTVARLCPQKRQPKTDIEKISFFSDELKKLLKHYGNAVSPLSSRCSVRR